MRVVNQKSSCGWWSCCVCLVLCIVAAACGKKGPPLAPIVRIPAAIPSIQAHRVGSEAFITLAVPSTNIDRSMPADIVRIEVYGYTGRRPPPAARWVEFGELVASIPVIPPPAPDAAPAPPVPVDPTKGALPGAMVTVLDRLTGPKLVQGKVEEAPARGGRAPTPVAQTTDIESDVLHRYYIATPFSARGRPGPPSPAADFALIDTPEPPAFVVAPYSETQVALQWPPSGGIIGFLFSPGLPTEDAPLNDLFEPIVQPTAAGTTAAVPTGPVRYNVYRDVEPDPFALPDPAAHLPWTEVPPMPINPAPLDAMTFSDSVEFNRQRCYSIRAVRGATRKKKPACRKAEKHRWKWRKFRLLHSQRVAAEAVAQGKLPRRRKPQRNARPRRQPRKKLRRRKRRKRNQRAKPPKRKPPRKPLRKRVPRRNAAANSVAWRGRPARVTGKG